MIVCVECCTQSIIECYTWSTVECWTWSIIECYTWSTYSWVLYMIYSWVLYMIYSRVLHMIKHCTTRVSKKWQDHGDNPLITWEGSHSHQLQDYRILTQVVQSDQLCAYQQAITCLETGNWFTGYLPHTQSSRPNIFRTPRHVGEVPCKKTNCMFVVVA